MTFLSLVQVSDAARYQQLLQPEAEPGQHDQPPGHPQAGAGEDGGHQGQGDAGGDCGDQQC